MIGFDEKVLIAEFRNILIQGHIGHCKVAINMHFWGKVMNINFINIDINIIIKYVNTVTNINITGRKSKVLYFIFHEDYH